MSDADRRRQLRRLLEGYFDTKTQELVRGVVQTASPEELTDDDAMDALFDEFVGLLRERYDREDPGWHAEAVSFLRGEFERQVERARASRRDLERLLEEEDPPGGTS